MEAKRRRGAQPAIDGKSELLGWMHREERYMVDMYVGVRYTATKTSERSKQPIDCLYAVNGKASQGYLFASYYTGPYILIKIPGPGQGRLLMNRKT